MNPACHKPTRTLSTGPKVFKHSIPHPISISENRRMSRAFTDNNNSFNVSNISFTHNIASFSVSNISFIATDDEPQILAWLSPLEPLVRHHDICEQRVDSVGNWLLETEEFGSWYNGSVNGGSDRAALFCYGEPGVGKSYIWYERLLEGKEGYVC